jgi:Planctomycete cytochrome C
MLLRTRLVLFGIGTVLLLTFSWLLLHVPPDGLEHGELNQFVGRFHPLAVHLPIALLLLVALLESAGSIHRWNHLRLSAGFVLTLSAISVFISVFLGWLLAWSGGYEGNLVTSHMWGGFSLAVGVMFCYFLRAWDKRLYGVALLATLLILVWTTDKGGKLTHGEAFMTRHMPGRLRTLLNVPAVRNNVQPPVGSASLISASGNAAPLPSATFYASRVAPIFEDKCSNCHNAEKRKGKLRLDTFENVMRGGKDGIVIKPGDTSHSELFRRINLPPEDKDFMPTDGKPPLTSSEIKVIELWIASGASSSLPALEVRGAPPLPILRSSVLPLAGDYRPQLKIIAALEQELGVQLVPRSQNPTDGLILRTMSAPERCDDAALARLKSIGNLIVDAELARTKVTDAGLKILATFSNIRSLDLAHTTVTSTGVPRLADLNHLETLNLTATLVDDAGIAKLRRKQTLKRLYLFETKCTVPSKTESNNEKP